LGDGVKGRKRSSNLLLILRYLVYYCTIGSFLMIPSIFTLSVSFDQKIKIPGCGRNVCDGWSELRGFLYTASGGKFFREKEQASTKTERNNYE
jgi:hypothetical protein